jgi:prophage maintenance system killer protein
LRQVVYPNKLEIIEENRKEIEHRLRIDPTAPEAFVVADDRLNTVLDRLNKECNESDWKKKIVRKASFFIAGLSWAQPFGGANKTTAVLMAMLFMRDNGFDLNIPPAEQNNLIDFMYRIQEERSELDSQLVENLILYVDQFTVSL